MYNRLLVALDGSELSEGILPYARSFAKTLGIPVELLHVVDPDHFLYSVFAYHGRYYDIMTAEKKRSIDYLRKIATSFAGSASVDCSVETGNPAEVIVDRAASHAGILIAMTTHGRSGAKRWLLGGIAEKVLRAATNPLLLARSTEETKISDAVVLKTLLVPLDGSGVAETVLPHVAELAKKMNLRRESIIRLATMRQIGNGLTKKLEAKRTDIFSKRRNSCREKGWKGCPHFCWRAMPQKRSLIWLERGPRV